MDRQQEYSVLFTEAELKAIKILIEVFVAGQLPVGPTRRIMYGPGTNIVQDALNTITKLNERYEWEG